MLSFNVHSTQTLRICQGLTRLHDKPLKERLDTNRSLLLIIASSVTWYGRIHVQGEGYADVRLVWIFVIVGFEFISTTSSSP